MISTQINSNKNLNASLFDDVRISGSANRNYLKNIGFFEIRSCSKQGLTLQFLSYYQQLSCVYELQVSLGAEAAVFVLQH
jgi:hypothetical protein